VNEEAGFIAALLAEPDDRTTLLVYADWLDERSDPRAEYLRLLVANRSDQQRLAQLRHTLDRDWVQLVDYRHWKVGRQARISEGEFTGYEGNIVEVSDDRRMVRVQLIYWDLPLDVDLLISPALELVPIKTV
jgi:uncharacterized protein (TIGR02996 family)